MRLLRFFWSAKIWYKVCSQEKISIMVPTYWKVKVKQIANQFRFIFLCFRSKNQRKSFFGPKRCLLVNTSRLFEDFVWRSVWTHISHPARLWNRESQPVCELLGLKEFLIFVPSWTTQILAFKQQFHPARGTNALQKLVVLWKILIWQVIVVKKYNKDTGIHCTKNKHGIWERPGTVKECWNYHLYFFLLWNILEGLWHHINVTIF